MLFRSWEGKKELFNGLAIEQLEADNPEAWQPYPVFYFDLNGTDYTKENALESTLSKKLTIKSDKGEFTY